ncbi:hypothetical protein [Vibrio brasiliensis]
MKSNLFMLVAFGSLLTGCVTNYVEPNNTENVASLTMEAEGEGALLAGLQVRFWHLENAGKCDMWEIEGERALMHTMQIGGLPTFSYDDKPKTLPIESGEKSNFLVTAISGDLMCAIISDFVPKNGESYILKFDGVLQAFGNSACSIELKSSESQPIESFQERLCFKPY